MVESSKLVAGDLEKVGLATMAISVRMVESNKPADSDLLKGGKATAAISVKMVESSNSAAEDLEKGPSAGTAAEPSAAVSVWSYIRWYTPRIILWSVILWINVIHLIDFGPWSELAFFLVGTMPLVVLLHLAGRQPDLVDEQVEQEKPTQVLPWEDMAMAL